MTALVHTSHIASVFGFRYSAFGFRLSAFGLLPAAFGFRLSASGFRLLASSVQLPLSAFGFRRLDPQPRTSLRLMSPNLSRVAPLPNGLFMACKWESTNHLLTNWDNPPGHPIVDFLFVGSFPLLRSWCWLAAPGARFSLQLWQRVGQLDGGTGVSCDEAAAEEWRCCQFGGLKVDALGTFEKIEKTCQPKKTRRVWVEFFVERTSNYFIVQ